MNLIVHTFVALLASVATIQEPLPSWPALQTSPVDRFLGRSDLALRSYRGHRRLEATNARFKAEAWMEVATELTPAGGFSWTVIDEGGSRYIRNNVLRKALDAEVAAVRGGDPSRAAITDANYHFAVVDYPDSDTARVRIEPRRRDVMLVSGLILLTRDAADLVQVEGRLSKNPSFWMRSVHVVRRYRRANGIRVPVAMESTATVRVAGRSEFRMTYVYEVVNEEPVTMPLGG